MDKKHNITNKKVFKKNKNFITLKEEIPNKPKKNKNLNILGDYFNNCSDFITFYEEIKK